MAFTQPPDLKNLIGLISATLTDAGGVFDTDPLRPDLLVLTRKTTGSTIPGVGGQIVFRVPDLSGNIRRIAKSVVEVTNPNPGAVASTHAWTVLASDSEVETFRIRGGAGMLPTFIAGGSTAQGGGTSGMVGGQLWVRGDLLATGYSTVGPLAFAQRTTQVSTNLSATGDYYLWVNTSVSGLTITLPTAIGFPGLTFVIKLVNATNTATINTTGGQTIDGQSSILINVLYESLTLASDNSNWNLT